MNQRIVFLSLAVIGPALLLGGCGGHTPTREDKAPSVKVSTPVKREVTDYAIFTGRVDAKSSVEVRSRVSGYLNLVDFTAGEYVKEGKTLFQIDPRPYKADVDKVDGQIVAQAAYKLALANYAREQELAASRSTSARELDVALARAKEAEAQITALKASRESADLNLKFTDVKAPIDGVVSRNLITVGNLVTQDKTLLTTIVSENPMQAYFDVDENALLRYQKMVRDGKIPVVKGGGAKINFGLSSDGDTFPHEGKLDFVNNQLDAKTGTIQIRAELPNPESKIGPRLLTSGLFIRVRLPLGQAREVLLVPQSAVVTQLGQKFLMVVNADNKVESRPVEMGAIQPDGLQVAMPLKVVRTETGLRAAREGETGIDSLLPTDRVIVSGLQRVRAGLAVTVVG